MTRWIPIRDVGIASAPMMVDECLAGRLGCLLARFHPRVLTLGVGFVLGPVMTSCPGRQEGIWVWTLIRLRRS